MENKVRSTSLKVLKFIKGILWSLLVALVLGVILNVAFLRSVRNYTNKHLQNPPPQSRYHEADSSNRVVRFSAALLFSQHLQRQQTEPLVCRAICNSSTYQFQDVESPVASAVLFYNQKGLAALDDFNFSLGVYILNLMAQLFPQPTLEAFEQAMSVDSWTADLALSLKMQFDFFGMPADLQKQMRQFKSRLDAVPDLAELNMVCQAERITPEQAHKNCVELLQEEP